MILLNINLKYVVSAVCWFALRISPEKLISKDRNKTNRETIEEGRNDSILHIKYKNNNANTYSSLKPNDVEWKINIEDYPNSDFFKLPEKIQDLYKNNNKIIIPTETENGRYVNKLQNVIVFQTFQHMMVCQHLYSMCMSFIYFNVCHSI